MTKHAPSAIAARLADMATRVRPMHRQLGPEDIDTLLAAASALSALELSNTILKQAIEIHLMSINKLFEQRDAARNRVIELEEYCNQNGGLPG